MVAYFPGDVAIARNDVERRTAGDDAGVHGRERHVEGVVERTFGRETARDASEIRDELAGDLHRIHALRRQRRMRLVAANRGLVRMLALVRDHDLHAGRFTHDAAGRLVAVVDHLRDQVAHADAADFLVVAERQVHRALELSPEQFGDHHQRGGAVPLHVGHAAAIELVADDGCDERIGVPGLAVDRHHVGVARQHDAADLGLAVFCGQRGPEVRLAAGVVVGEVAFDVV